MVVITVFLNSLFLKSVFLVKSQSICIWLAIATCEKHEVIGEIGLLRMYPAWWTSDLTIIIPHEAHQGKGYGTEANRPDARPMEYT